MDSTHPLGHTTTEHCISVSMKRRLRELSPRNRRAVIELLLEPGWVLSSPERETAIANVKTFVESLIRRERRGG